MLNLILGKDPFNKTEYVRDLVANKVSQGEKCILIVPEQFSFETEKAMLERVGANKMLAVDVLSLSRLAELTVEKYGKIKTKPAADDAVKMMTMSLALEALSTELSVYGKYASRSQLIAQLVSFATEIKQWTVSIDLLENYANQAKASSLKTKLGELVKIISLYNAMLENSYYDTGDILGELVQVLDEKNIFENTVVAIDGFTRFTKQEYAVVERIIKQANDVYVTFDCDMSDDEYSLFANNNKQVRMLKLLAQKNCVKTAPIIKTENDTEEVKECLLKLTSSVFVPESEPAQTDPKGSVELLCAQNKADECEFVAMTVKKLLREKSARCKDIIVFERTEGDYGKLLAAALKKYGVPFFEDMRQPIDTQPLIVYIRSLLETVCSGLNTQTLMRHLKTGLTDITDDEISELENYAFVWKINSSQWKNEFTENPNGFGREMSEFDEKKLDSLNRIRKKAVLPILKFKKEFTDAQNEKKTEVLYNYLVKNSIAGKMKKAADDFFEQGKTALSQQQDAVWSLVCDMLDKLYSTSKNTGVSNSRYFELFDILLSVSDFGTVPQGLDTVTLCSADRARNSRKKYVFVLGANDGVFPLNPSTQGLLSDKERILLKNAGIELAETAEYKLTEEKYIVYRTLSSACETVFISYSKADFQGTALSESSIVREVKRIFPNISVIEYDCVNPIEKIESGASAFEVYAQNYSYDNAFVSSLREYLISDERYSGRIRTLENSAKKTEISIENSETATELFGKNMHLSASKTEVYHKCPFQYFCKHGLNAQPRREASVDPAVSGSLIHETFEKILSRFSKDELLSMTEEKLRENVVRIMNGYLEEKMGGDANKSKRFIKQYALIGEQIVFALSKIIEEMKVSDFVPTDFELPINYGSQVQPYELDLSDGGKLFVSGSVDRVDIMEKNGKKYLRVVDYKSNGKTFRLSDVVSGLSTQMLIYLFTLVKNGKEKYGETVPAGVLYMPAKYGKSDLSRNATGEEIGEKLLKSNKMDGLVVNDMEIIQSMEHDVSGRFIPVSLKNDGSFSKNSKLINADDLKLLNKKIDGILKNMAVSLHKGQIPVLPVNEDACKYCDYAEVCGFENGDMYRGVVSADNSEIIEMLKGEESENG